MAARPDITAIRQWLWGTGRRAVDLAARCFDAARREAGKDKYREYLSDAYGRMKQRYPKVDSAAREALDAIGVRPAEAEPAEQAPTPKAAPTRKKTAAKKKKKKKKKTVAGPKTASMKTTVAKKKTASRKKTR